MRWAFGLAAVALVATVGAVVLAVRGTRDPVPARLRACVVAGQAQVVLSEGDLGSQVRSDIGARALRTAGRTALGEDTVVVLRGTGYRLLVLAGRKSPPLSGDLPLRVFTRASSYGLVAKERDPSRGVLEDCVAAAQGGRACAITPRPGCCSHGRGHRTARRDVDGS